VALGRLTADTAEMRTLFVRPAFRGLGAGRQLAEAALDEARRFGYSTVRLDTLRLMESAQTLYRSLGFYDIAPYRDLSESLKRYICFFERRL
jgi:ribosomal protein S18 acetylase RimI-like enzyme